MILDLNYTPKELVYTAALTEEEWLLYRRNGFGGSDIGAVYGCSPFQTAKELYYEKKGMYKNTSKNWVAMEVGHRLEDLVAEIFQRKTGYLLEKPDIMYQHPLFPFMLADIDRFYVTPEGNTGVLEIKTSHYFNKAKWEDNGIPYHYELQVRHYLAVTNLEEAYICCLFGNQEGDFIMRRIERDLVKEEDLIFSEEYFWETFILGNQEPPYVENPDMVLKSMEKHITAKPEIEPYELEKSDETFLCTILELKKKKANLEKQARMLGAEIKAYSIPIIEKMGEKCYGEYHTDKGDFGIFYMPKESVCISAEALERLKMEHRHIYDIYASKKVSRNFVIKELKKKR